MIPRCTPHIPSGDTAGIDPIVAPLIALLGQLEWVVRRLDDRDYTVQRAVGISGSIGSHLRHSLDHVVALTAGAASGCVDYDHRRRGTAVESCRVSALLEIDHAVRDLRTLTSFDLDRSLELVAAIDREGTRLSAVTSVGRELAFVMSHTTHHLAVIALLLRDLGIEVPPRFGYAPTTPTRNATAA